MLLKIDIAKVKEGDTLAFQHFFELLYPKLVAHACRFVDEQTARDLVQDLFTVYWEQKNSIEADNIITFFYKWLHNRCIDHLRHQKVVDAYEAKIQLAEQRASSMENYLENNDVLKRMEAQDIRQAIESALKKLPPKQAEAFRLCYFNDMTHKEIAEQMGISHRTVETHIYQSLIVLRKELKHLLILFIIAKLNGLY